MLQFIRAETFKHTVSKPKMTNNQAFASNDLHLPSYQAMSGSDTHLTTATLPATSVCYVPEYSQELATLSPPSYSESVESSNSYRESVYGRTTFNTTGSTIRNHYSEGLYGPHSVNCRMKTSDHNVETRGIYTIKISTKTVICNGQEQLFTVYIVRNRSNLYLLVAALVSVFCFLPTGLCALGFALNARYTSKWGDEAGAHKMLTYSRRLSVLSLLIGLLIIPGVICIILFVFVVNSA